MLIEGLILSSKLLFPYNDIPVAVIQTVGFWKEVNQAQVITLAQANCLKPIPRGPDIESWRRLSEQLQGFHSNNGYLITDIRNGVLYGYTCRYDRTNKKDNVTACFVTQRIPEIIPPSSSIFFLAEYSFPQ